MTALGALSNYRRRTDENRPETLCYVQIKTEESTRAGRCRLPSPHCRPSRAPSPGWTDGWPSRHGRRRLPSPRRRSSRAPPPFLASAAAGPELRWPSVASLAGRRRLPGFAAEKVVGVLVSCGSAAVVSRGAACWSRAARLLSRGSTVGSAAVLSRGSTVGSAVVVRDQAGTEARRTQRNRAVLDDG